VYGHELTYGDVTGDEIRWKKGMDLTVKKGADGKKVPTESFFTWFRVPTKATLPLADSGVEGNDNEMLEFDDEDLEAMMDWLMNEHFEWGDAFKEQLIPYAVHWYTGEAALYEEDDEEDEGDEEDEEGDEEDDLGGDGQWEHGEGYAQEHHDEDHGGYDYTYEEQRHAAEEGRQRALEQGNMTQYSHNY